MGVETGNRSNPVHLTYRTADIPARILTAWGRGETDWQRTIEQPTMTLLTDDGGSWGLVERHSADLIEVHFGIAPAIVSATVSVRQTIAAARDMLDWIETNFGPARIVAKTKNRPTGIFLRWCGFRDCGPMTHDGAIWAVYRWDNQAKR